MKHDSGWKGRVKSRISPLWRRRGRGGGGPIARRDGQGRPRRMVKVCSIGVNVLCERASILARGSLGRAPFRTVPLAARHPLIRIRVFNLARRVGEGEGGNEG